MKMLNGQRTSMVNQISISAQQMINNNTIKTYTIIHMRGIHLQEPQKTQKF